MSSFLWKFFNANQMPSAHQIQNAVMNAADAPGSPGPRLLFIPVSGPKGAGEYIRSLTLAQACVKQWPHAFIHFILSKKAVYARSAPFDTTLINGSPTVNTDAVLATIDRFAPDICIIDSGGRTRLFRYLKKKQIPAIYVSSRASTRQRAFRWLWMGLIRRHWIVQPSFVGGPLTRMEKRKIKWTRSQPPLFLETLFPAPDTARRAAFFSELGLTDDAPYLVFCSGGGGKRGDGKQAPDIFAEAARQVSAQTGIRCLVIMGPNYPGAPEPHPRVITLKSVTNETFIDLIAGAHMLAIGGGSSIAQALATRKVAVVAPAAGDQQNRINRTNRLGVIDSAPLDADAISAHLLALLSDENRVTRIKHKLDALGLTNGLPRAMACLSGIWQTVQEERR